MKSSKEKATSKQESTPSENELVEVENPLAELNPKMQRFVHLFMTGQYSMAKLAQLLEVHPNTLYNWMNRSDVKHAITGMKEVTHEVVKDRLNGLTVKAIERMYELMDSPIDGVALQAVKDVLDRGGHKAKQEIKVDKTVRTFEEKLSELIDDVIDIDFEEVEQE